MEKLLNYFPRYTLNVSGGIVNPTERLPVGATILLSLQHALAMTGSTISEYPFVRFCCFSITCSMEGECMNDNCSLGQWAMDGQGEKKKEVPGQ